MIKSFLFTFILAGLLTCFSNYLYAQENANYDSIAKVDSIAHTKHHHPIPLECSKVKAGYTNDKVVMALYGQGLFDPNDGHGGARYFVDSAKRVILKTVLGTDNIIEEVALTEYNYPFDFVKNQLKSLPAANALIPAGQLIKGVKLGSSPEAVIKAYGKPNVDKKTGINRVLIYEDDNDLWSEVLFYNAVFEFKNNKLQRISIYNGD